MERTTAQRKAIHTVLEEAGRPMSPPEIFEAARSIAPGLGMATVYRTIKRMLDDGVLAAVELPGEAPRYERAGLGHHHHFRCNDCNKVFDLTGCASAFDKCLPKGFALESHEIFLFGRCETCATG
ncbi:MAG: transcriptional repressor [Candidatus Eisenbacteria bacterium]|nr:transcriptional repressor [Candidatus Eisenbacteria bacterium]